MASTCPTGFNVDRLREQVRAQYDRLATSPDGDFHFHRGAHYAAEFLAYDAAEPSSPVPQGLVELASWSASTASRRRPRAAGSRRISGCAP